MEYLFVYGTLQDILDNEMSRFLSTNSEIFGKGFIHGKLYKISWFPGAVLSKTPSEKVYGSIFKLKTIENTFKVLDNYEGCDANNPKTSLFFRETTTVFLENGNIINAWVYLYNQNVDDKKRIFSRDFLKDA
ncbi:gamma-glutamylcyclotransferase [Hyunsoonleella flava]|uniref:Gamma-glutamylcyclotransferase n=1 Tax=Hyunsoonleella flava TaxID=2527939 RepID=A0A4Q9FJD6_9FLAO|nr:gamma-glutamylcyclotransferase family protein [Hyunsoonleella flava]TBN06374.1 gamma-glutamylcyclotransferase [Hyunsoonleella flava]